MKSDRSYTISVFFFLLALYLAFSGDRYDRVPVSDEEVMIRTTATMVNAGSLRVELPEALKGQETKYGLGQSLAGAPLCLLAGVLIRWMPEGVPPEAVFIPVIYAANALICAAIGAMFFAMARRLGYKRRPAIAGALIVGAATIVAVYSKTFFSEPLVALSLLGAAGAYAGRMPAPPKNGMFAPQGDDLPPVLFTDRMPVPPWAWFRAGAWLALALLTRFDNVIIIPVFLAGLWLGVESSRRREALRGTGLFALPLLLITLTILWTNHLRSGRFQLSGYTGETFSTSFPSGLFGLLFSPAHGVFWFSPPLAVAIAYVVSFHRRCPRLCFVVFATVAVKLFIFAKWWNWFGGWSWGSRFLLPVVPLAMLAVLEPLSRWGRLRRMEKALIGAACVVGVLVQVCGLLVAPNALHGTIQYLAGAGSGRVQSLADQEQLLIFSPPQSPLIGNWPIVAHGRLDWFGLRFGEYFSPHLLTAILAVLGIVLIVSAWYLVRAWLSEKEEPQIAQISRISETPCASAQSAVEIEFPGSVRPTAWFLLFLNVAFFALMAIAIRGNGLWRTDRVESADGWKDESRSRVGSIYLDDRISGPAALRNRSTEWLGYLETPVSGTYSFYTVSLGAFELQLTGRPELTDTLTGGRRSLRADVFLQRGLHPLRLIYTPTTEASAEKNHWQRQMQLYWTIPGSGEYEQVIGRAWLYPTAPSPARRMLAFVYRLKVGFVIVSLIVLWWFWVHPALRLTGQK